MSEAQIKILLENNELDFLIELLKFEYGRNILFDPVKAQRIFGLISKLYKLQKS